MPKKGYKQTKEHIEKLKKQAFKKGNQYGKANKGLRRSQKTKDKIGRKMRGNIPWNKGKGEFGYLNRTKYCRQWRNKSLKNRLSANVKCNIWHSLKGKKEGRHWEILVGYVVKDLIKHLELQFDENMSWDNYGEYWEVDHIKPISLFNFNSFEDQEFKECWTLKNLQPLEKSANRIKHNKF